MNENAMTEKVLKCFEEISKIPRRSKNEEKIRAWLQDWAKEHQFTSKTDATGNLLIKVPASAGYEDAPIVILQGHLDMVCEKRPESSHDFSKDPIKLVYQDEWLTADGTTLGADNGIAIAMAMVVATDDAIEHPALELLFTVDEETGLTGARSLQPGFLEGKILLNLDSEDEGYFTVGCAGGKHTDLTVPMEYAPIDEKERRFVLKVGELKGGHSGVDIARYRANAIQLLARTLQHLLKSGEVRVAKIEGGSAHNAIPRDAWAEVFIREDQQSVLEAEVAKAEATLRTEFANTDPQMKITLTPAESGENRAMNLASTHKTVNLLLAIPHGVAAMSTDIPTLVETSNNLATIKVEGESVCILTSQRSSVMSRLNAHTERIEGIANLAGGQAESDPGYPAWQPNMDSSLLARCRALYKKMFAKEPVVEIIHAGLECGLIGSIYEGMDMISFGPTIKDPHSPTEKIHIGSINKVWDFLIELLKEFKPAQE